MTTTETTANERVALLMGYELRNDPLGPMGSGQQAWFKGGERVPLGALDFTSWSRYSQMLGFVQVQDAETIERINDAIWRRLIKESPVATEFDVYLWLVPEILRDAINEVCG